MIKFLLAIAATLITCTSSLVLPRSSSDITLHNESDVLDTIMAVCRSYGDDRQGAYDFVRSAFQQAQEVGIVRFSFRSKRSKKYSDSILSFAFGAVLGVTVVAISSGLLYLYACHQDQPCDKPKCDKKISVPHNLPWDKNWCWMVTSLQCLYPLQPFREWIKEEANKDTPNLTKKDQDRVRLASKIDNIFQRMDEYAKTDDTRDLSAQGPAVRGLKKSLDELYVDLFAFDKAGYGGAYPFAPDTPEAFHEANTFLNAMQIFLCIPYDESVPFGTKMTTHERDKSGYRLNFQVSAEKSMQDVVEEKASARKDRAGKLWPKIIDAKQLLCFYSSDKDCEALVDKTLKVGEKNYRLTSMGCHSEHPADWSAVVRYENDSWYLFDSLGKKRIPLKQTDVDSICQRNGYKEFDNYKPLLMIYEQI